MSSSDAFNQLISVHCARLYNLCSFILDKSNKDIVLNRRFLGNLNLEATWMEETLDSSGARHSEQWFPFREGVSAIKLFSSVAYDLNHVIRSFPYYNLIKSENEFSNNAISVLDEIYSAIINASEYLVKKARKCGLHSEASPVKREHFVDLDATNMLENDRKLRHIENPGKTLIYLATEFINLKAEMNLLDRRSALKKNEFKKFIPDTVSEEKLRLILVRYHNLQSLYDTYLSESDIENADHRLRSLRGHISFIFHMLKSATEFSHYYERHILPRQNSIFFKTLLPIEEDRFLEITIDFFLKYFEVYFNGAKELCFDVIESYAEICERDIKIPEYRGFHVRPSSLVSKIVNYYGGRVKMIVNGIEYDPSSPLELFRVNEEINAQKRVKLFEIIHSQGHKITDVNELLKKLSKKGHVIIYKNPLENIPNKENLSDQEHLKNTIAYLLASGQIDIKMNLTVKFVGDIRTVGDIEILSQNGYGEDKYGNNITLPKKLNYLKR
ncbi:MAG: hypothetical protein JXR64_05790 [Spirochaetales bacterium]|nr:hypothetical protein [Spirochaetales bacterium]